MKISVIIPTLNEEKTIGECIRKARKAVEGLGYECEVIVSDSSSDRTAEIAKSLGARVVFPDRKGYGYAPLYAFQHASGEIIVMGEGDGTYDFSEIPKLVEPIINGKADFVIGSRFKGKIHDKAMPWLHRYVGNPLLTWFANFFFKANGIRGPGILVWDLRGLFFRKFQIGSEQEIEVLPSIEKLREEAKIDARLRLSQARGVIGFPVEFVALRRFQEGDDTRRIDWKATARLGELIVREYLKEWEGDVYVALDIGREMREGSTR